MTTHPEADFWNALGPTDARARGVLEDRGYATEYANASDATERGQTLEDARGMVESLTRHYGSPNSSELDATDATDARWPLLHDLGVRWAEVAGIGAPTPPMRFRCGDEWDALGIAPLVTVSFDSRLSMRAVLSAIREVWPLMTSDGWVRRTRPLGDRKLALVRHVCLDMDTSATWRERLKAWNEKHRGAWAYKDALGAADVRGLQSDFRKAEKSLTGRTGGLARFYDEDSRTRAMPGYRDPRTAEQIWADLVAADEKRRADTQEGHHGKP